MCQGHKEIDSYVLDANGEINIVTDTRNVLTFIVFVNNSASSTHMGIHMF